MRKADLHLHSTASDGVLEPHAVVQAAASAGVTALSLTDHDTVAGLDEAAAECERLGMRYISGSEISANEPGVSIHLLAYGFDPQHPGLLAFLAGVHEARWSRVHEMISRLNGLGIPIAAKHVMDQAGAGSATRAHVSRALIAGGWVRSTREVFSRYLGRDCPGFVEKPPTPPASVIELVRQAGGVTLLAHPGDSFSEADIERWVADGLDGIEIMHPRNGPQERASLERLVVRHGLLRAGGSDWHGPDSGGAPVGTENVPGEWLDAIFARCKE
ncbi:MAG: PHP domain-containing protein [Gemmatimonadota bacterium]